MESLGLLDSISLSCFFDSLTRLPSEAACPPRSKQHWELQQPHAATRLVLQLSDLREKSRNSKQPSKVATCETIEHQRHLGAPWLHSEIRFLNNFETWRKCNRILMQIDKALPEEYDLAKLAGMAWCIVLACAETCAIRHDGSTATSHEKLDINGLSKTLPKGANFSQQIRAWSNSWRRRVSLSWQNVQFMADGWILRSNELFLKWRHLLEHYGSPRRKPWQHHPSKILVFVVEFNNLTGKAAQDEEQYSMDALSWDAFLPSHTFLPRYLILAYPH